MVPTEGGQRKVEMDSPLHILGKIQATIDLMAEVWFVQSCTSGNPPEWLGRSVEGGASA